MSRSIFLIDAVPGSIPPPSLSDTAILFTFKLEICVAAVIVRLSSSQYECVLQSKAADRGSWQDLERAGPLGKKLAAVQCVLHKHTSREEDEKAAIRNGTAYANPMVVDK